MNFKKLLLLFFFPCVLTAQYQGPVSAISNGYGSDGANSVTVITITNDHWLAKKISIFYPTGTSTPVPTIFYAHGFASSDTTFHIENLRHLASRGYAVVFVPYKSAGVTHAERYATLFDGFTKAATNLPSIIDITRVGFFGQSYGGGATTRIAYRAFTENNWGANGKFIYCSAPWYAFELGATNLADFPTDCKMISIVYDDDINNDHRMAMDVFDNIAIDIAEKDFIIVYSTNISGYDYEADHTLPANYTTNGEFDALDCYATFRLIDALADYTFTGNLSAKDIALGNGSAAQIDMGGQLPNLFVTNNPVPIYQEAIYNSPCSDPTNERQVFCPSLLAIENLVPLQAKVLPEGQVELKWATASETNNKGFDMQRSFDGIIFESIGFVNGKGNMLTANYYTAIDSRPAIDNYYRYKQIDFDGTSHFSNVVYAHIAKEAIYNIKVYPNPLSGNLLHFDFDLNRKVDLSIEIYDVNGILKKAVGFVNTQKGNHQLEMARLGLSPGVYFVKFIVAEEIYFKKIFII